MIIEKLVDFMWNDPCRLHVEWNIVFFQIAFLKACLMAWHDEIDKKPPSMSTEEACEILNITPEILRLGIRVGADHVLPWLGATPSIIWGKNVLLGIRNGQNKNGH